MLICSLQDRRLVDSYRTETASKLKEIAELSDPDAPRVFHVTKCSACHTPLELPIVHFMCKHSYHGGRSVQVSTLKVSNFVLDVWPTTRPNAPYVPDNTASFESYVGTMNDLLISMRYSLMRWKRMDSLLLPRRLVKEY